MRYQVVACAPATKIPLTIFKSNLSNCMNQSLPLAHAHLLIFTNKVSLVSSAVGNQFKINHCILIHIIYYLSSKWEKTVEFCTAGATKPLWDQDYGVFFLSEWTRWRKWQKSMEESKEKNQTQAQNSD